jgi:hypothetical protein
MIGYLVRREQGRRQWLHAQLGVSLSVLALAAGCSSDSSSTSNTGGSGGTAGSVAGNSAGGAINAAGTAGNSAAAGHAGAAGENTEAGASGTGDAGSGGDTVAGGTGGSAAGSGGSTAGSAGTGGAATTGGGGAGGSTAGSGGGGTGGGGTGGGGTGGGGTSGGGTGGGGAGGGGTGGTGGTGGSGGAAPVNPVGAAVVGSALTGTIMGTTGDPTNMFGVWDTCPDDQVVVGFKYVGFSDFISGLQAVCGKLTVTNTDQIHVSITAGATLLARGGSDPVSNGSAMCPANSAVVGFSGKVDDRIRLLTFTCAPLVVVYQDGAATIGTDLDNKAPLATIGPKDQGNDFAFTGCADGQMARGSSVQESEFRDPNGWAESLTLMCGKPNFTYPNDTACTLPTDCDSRACDTTCKPLTCDAPTGCTCEPFAGKNYAFCPPLATSDALGAEGVCETKGLHLALVSDAATAGWMRNAANAAGVTADAFIGIDDLAVHGTWASDPGGVTVSFTNWGGGGYGLEPNCLVAGCTAIENCVTVRADGAWNNVDCALKEAFVCSN